MYCRNCGYPMDPNSMICTNCGCGKGVGSTYCPNCGQPVMSGSAVCTACNCRLYTQPANVKGKSKIVAGLLGIFLGGLGIHNFYLGYIGKGIAQIFLSCLGIGQIWGLIEGILILCGTINTDATVFPCRIKSHSKNWQYHGTANFICLYGFSKDFTKIIQDAQIPGKTGQHILIPDILGGLECDSGIFAADPNGSQIAADTNLVHKFT